MRKKNRRTFLRTVGATVAGASVLGTAAAEPDDDGIEIHRDVSYRDTPQGTLTADLYLPDDHEWNATVVWIHGGGWYRGDKRWLAQKAADMARQGYAGVAINYRLSGTARYPAAVTDVKAAIKWVRENAVEYKFDENHVALVGRSAGAHLAALAGTTANDPRFQPDDFDPAVSSRVQGVVGYYGIYDFRPLKNLGPDPAAVKFLGGTYDEVTERYHEASPAVHVTPDDPPHLLLHGTEDERIPYRASVGYQRVLEAAGVTADLFTAPGAGHSFDATERWYRPTFDVMNEFLETHVPNVKGRRRGGNGKSN